MKLAILKGWPRAQFAWQNWTHQLMGPAPPGLPSLWLKGDIYLFLSTRGRDPGPEPENGPLKDVERRYSSKPTSGLQLPCTSLPVVFTDPPAP